MRWEKGNINEKERKWGKKERRKEEMKKDFDKTTK